jgi:hypothetical protein
MESQGLPTPHAEANQRTLLSMGFTKRKRVQGDPQPASLPTRHSPGFAAALAEVAAGAAEHHANHQGGVGAGRALPPPAIQQQEQELEQELQQLREKAAK